MTDKEVFEKQQVSKIIQLTADLWNEILKLEEIHPSDNLETARDIHDTQNRIMARQYQIKQKSLRN